MAKSMDDPKANILEGSYDGQLLPSKPLILLQLYTLALPETRSHKQLKQNCIQLVAREALLLNKTCLFGYFQLIFSTNTKQTLKYLIDFDEIGTFI